jgi:membrane-associated phospholipid phosphatase
LATAGTCVFALALVWVLAELVPTIHRQDAVLLHTFTALDHPRLDGVARSLTALLDPLPFIAYGAALVGVALACRRPWIALAVVAIMSLAPLTSETLKPLLAHSHAEIPLGSYVPPASWPSGHATAALALALCTVLVAPHRLRVAVALIGAVFAIAIGCSQLILARHMPSDVVGGYLVAMFWASLAVAALRVVDRARRDATA